MISKGKQFESKFNSDWLKSFPDGFLYRLPDQMNGYKTTSKNICDFIGFNLNTLYLIECKSHKGASLPLGNITQYDNLVSKVGIKGVRSGVVLWLYEKDKVFYIPTSTLIKLKKDGEKSVGLRHLGTYNIIEIPSVKKRVFMDSDYTILTSLKEGE